MQTTRRAATPAFFMSQIESEVQRIRSLIEASEFASALAAAEPALAEVPENRDLLYMRAVCLRYLRRLPEALAALEAFERLHPGYGRLFQERGHCYRGLGRVKDAIAAYERAVALNAALPASWRALHDMYRANMQHARARHAAQFADHMDQLPPAVVAASSHLNEGDIYVAEAVIRDFLQQQPKHIEAMRLLAQIGVKLDVLDDAEFLLESALEFAPQNRIVRYEYACVLERRHKFPQALEQCRLLLEQDPGNRAFRTVYANVCVGLGQHEEALDSYRRLLTDAPQNAELHLSIAHTLKTLGRRAEAIEAYRQSAAARPDFGDAFWSLANLKTYQFPDDEIAHMRTQEARPETALVDRYHLCFALGKAFEDRADYAESFRYYERGNALKCTEIRYSADAMMRSIEAQQEVCTAEFFAARRGSGDPRPDPIFIVGLPRSGSTLLEQILASHSQVEGTMELPDIPRLAFELNGRDRDQELRYPRILREVPLDQFQAYGARYLESTRVYRQSAPFFIDKMPNNFRQVGLIHLILPNAKIIDARREPMACCFSNFKQLFAAGQEFTYSLEDIGRYYRGYLELMDHWERVLPGKVLRVQYEDVVRDLEGNVRRILDFCGLEFEPACLDFHKTERSVRTASSEQVRQPIFTEGLDQWRHFEPWLEPLRAALGEVVSARRTAP